MDKSRIIVWASGGPEPGQGGSGFRNLVNWSRWGLDYEVVAVVSNYERGGVRTIADELGIPFHFFGGPFNLTGYTAMHHELESYGALHNALSGWIKCFIGAEGMEGQVFNIHPGPLPGEFGGEGKWGHYVHEAVMEAFRAHRITHSAVSMHFVTWKVDEAGNPDPNFYDAGPCFFRYPVLIRPEFDVDELATAVNAMEHVWQPYVTELVANGQIFWDGRLGPPPEVPAGSLFGHFAEPMGRLGS